MVEPIVISNLPPPNFLLPELIDAQLKANEGGIRQAKTAFTKACDQSGIPCEWRTSQVPSHVRVQSGRDACHARQT